MKIILKDHRNNEIENFKAKDFDENKLFELLSKKDLWWKIKVEYENGTNCFDNNRRRIIASQNGKNIFADWNISIENGKATNKDLKDLINSIKSDIENLEMPEWEVIAERIKNKFLYNIPNKINPVYNQEVIDELKY